MIRQKFLVLMSIVSFSIDVRSQQNDDDIKRCKIDDDVCILSEANEIIRKYYKGHSSISLSSLDPLLIKQLAVIQDLNAVKIDGRILDTNLTGISKAKLSKITGFDSGRVEMKINIPIAQFEGQYKIKGKILRLPIEGKGKFKVTMTDLDLHLNFTLNKKTIDGKIFYHAQKPKMTLSIKGGSASLSHLGSIASSFLNWSFVIIINAIQESFCKPFSMVFIESINSVFDNVAVEDLVIIDVGE